MCFAKCGLLLHGEQKCNTKIEKWKNSAFCIVLPILCAIAWGSKVQHRNKKWKKFRFPLHGLC